ncbi:unnamed protein product [Rotaria sordida]|uniref:CARD domain-containing protein n=1 Tax=Rotaria sordida TaxID=392033 RepID=A0A818IWH3_9BILA|nr:unnamed protein product [Rotaria sordida]CAF3532322.1 unnamed protein product [Rotaria sordida]
MVNLKKRDILERYRSLLENNLILTDDFFQWFKEKKVLPDFVFDDIKILSSSYEKNKKLLQSVIDNGDLAFTKLAEGLIANGQPFLGELLESEDKKASDSADAAERVVIDDDMLRKCPGIDKLRSDARDKLKTYLQTQLLKAHLNDTWKSQSQGKSVEVINLKRQHYEAQQKLVETIEEEKRNTVSLKDSLRKEQLARQQKEDELQELRHEVGRLQSDFQHKWSNQTKMVDANNRSLFKMNDKMEILIDWLGTLDNMFNINLLQTAAQYDSVEQLQNKLRRYTTEIESLRIRGVGTDKLKEELYESLYTSRYLPIEDRKNKPFYDLLVHLYGINQVTELSRICTNDVLQSKLERDQAHEIRIRDIKIDELNRLNQELHDEIDRLKSRATSSIEQSTVKPNKSQYRPLPTSVAVTQREKPKPRQTLKPVSVQFGTKPGVN